MLEIIMTFFLVLFIISIIFIILCEGEYGSICRYSVVIILSTIITALITYHELNEGYYKESTTHIYSISNPYNSIQGAFILGSGSFKSSEMYSYFVKVGKNSFKKKYIPVSDTTIILTNEESPKVIRKECENETKIGFIKIYSENSCETKFNVKEGVSYILILPENSIIQKFNVN